MKAVTPKRVPVGAERERHKWSVLRNYLSAPPGESNQAEPALPVNRNQVTQGSEDAEGDGRREPVSARCSAVYAYEEHLRSQTP
ncbi:hypothetical protein NDU88_010873 [Pleurodeles waltl]|uniref:Uncharacterized protein n=1 Tax=Pleurodeles waltl TaxID=8319 RepID=A0AAV7S3T8_PLEWA|nr:hypothetical protein NDU88_010873 [Pleurodeles waltl]